MKVLHITEAFEGGVIEFLRCLTNATPDIDYTIVYGRPQFFEKAKDSFPANVEFVPWPSAGREIRPLTDIKAVRELMGFLKTKGPFDILHLHSSKAGILGRIAGMLKGYKRIIYAPHAAAFLRKDVSALTKRLYILFEQMGAIFPGKVIGVSKSEAESYQQIGIKAGYVNNGKYYPTHHVKPPKQDNIIRIVTTGRITIQKNPTLFNEIAARFMHNPLIQFIWVGEGPDREKITAANITITGWVDKARVEYELRQADIYLSTALWEGLPYAVLEAMSMDLPLVLSSCPGNTDVLQHNVNGFLYDALDEAVQHIEYLIAHPENAFAMGRAGYQMLLNEFSVEKMAAGYRKLYTEMTASS